MSRGGAPVSSSDTTPDAFSFTDQTNVSTSSTITSAAITVAGINAAATITISGGTYDINSSGSFTSSSGTVNNGDTVRARHTSSASNSTATNTTVTIGGVSDTFTSTTSSGAGTEIFNPGDLGGYAAPSNIFTTDVNNHDGGTTSLVTPASAGISASPFGSSKIIRIGYPNDEAGTQLCFPAFSATQSLYHRFYFYLPTSWSGVLPVGLKFTRQFTTTDYTTINDAYASPKLWNIYLDPETGFNPQHPTPGDPDATDFWGVCTAILDLDVGAAFSDPALYGVGSWHSNEIYTVLNSSDGAADGILEWRIDGDTVYSSSTVKWVDTARGVPNGLGGWRSMWFGGNYSGGDYGRTTLSPTLYRYEDGYYVHTSPQWL